MQIKETRVLEVSASGRVNGSASRELSRDLISALQDRYGNVQTVHRDLANGVPFVDEAFIEANFTADEARTDKHRETLAYSDSLVAEIKSADILVIGVPIYNFSIPAALKAWIDPPSRAWSATGGVSSAEERSANKRMRPDRITAPGMPSLRGTESRGSFEKPRRLSIKVWIR